MSDHDAAQPEIDFEGYRQFIAQIELRDIWLVSSKLVNRHGPDMPEDPVQVSVSDKLSWTEIDGGFQATAHYSVRFKSHNRLMATVDAVFAADYESKEQMTDERFALFGRNNLPLNTWPYLREFLSSAAGRMGWMPFTLPARKINTGS